LSQLYISHKHSEQVWDQLKFNAELHVYE